MHSPSDNECLLACQQCATACLHCAAACLKEEHVQAMARSMARCIALDLECADFCQLTAASIARGDAHCAEICALCARICRACAAECQQHEMDHCQLCAQSCLRCAEACEQMAA